jgi:hypothetical protein
VGEHSERVEEEYAESAKEYAGGHPLDQKAISRSSERHKKKAADLASSFRNNTKTTTTPPRPPLLLK